MPEFRILTDEEIKNIYEEAQERANEGLKYAYDRQKEAQFNEEKSYDEAMKKYESDMEIFKKKYEEQHQQFLKSEETQKKFHEELQNGKIRAWEDMKKAKEKMGQPVNESTRPQRTPYPKKEFHYWGSVPQKPEKDHFIKSDPNSCVDILKSFYIYAKRTSSNHDIMERLYKMLNPLEESFADMDVTSDFLRNELLKEKIVTEQNRNKINYLVLREHFLNIVEERCCTISEASSDDPIVNGLYGEKLTVFELELMKAKNYKGNILHDLYIPAADGKYSQVDVLFVCSKGILVIESKNYSGTISGNEFDNNWNIGNKDSTPFGSINRSNPKS